MCRFVNKIFSLHLCDTYPCNLQLYDIRTMKELESFRGHTKDVTCKLSNSVMVMTSQTRDSRQIACRHCVSVHWLGL